jgi:hypothetical protein
MAFHCSTTSAVEVLGVQCRRSPGFRELRVEQDRFSVPDWTRYTESYLVWRFRLDWRLLRRAKLGEL